MMHSSTHFVGADSSGGSHGKNDKFISRYANRFQLELDKDWSIRETKLHILQMFLDGSIYDNLQPFYQEYQGGSGAYVKLINRRPSILYGLCKIVVDESISMLFDEQHFPRVRCSDQGHDNTADFLDYITRECNLKSVMINAARIGSIGSVAIVVKVLNGKFYFDVLSTKHLNPVFSQECPDELLSVVDKRKLDGASLMELGYDIPKENKNKYYFLEREWDDQQEIYYMPYLTDDKSAHDDKDVDNDRSTVHGLGFCPVVWIQNLPKAHHTDGHSTFEHIIDISIEIDYHLSQLGRGLYYNSDPTLVVKNPTSIEGQQFVKNVKILNLDEKGDAYYAEITGKSTSAVIEYVKILREYALEVCRGNRTSPDKISAAQSGKAMRMLNNPLVSLVSEMRLTYGDKGLIKLYSMCIDIYNSGSFEIETGDTKPDELDCNGHLFLQWPEWYPITGQDKAQEAQALKTYLETGILSRETAMQSIADEYDITNIDDEKYSIDNDKMKDQNKTNEKAMVEPKPKPKVEPADKLKKGDK